MSRASPTSFQLRWRESTYNAGTLVHVERYTGVATVVIDPPSTPERLQKNPLGLYVDAIDWSRELETPALPATGAAAVPRAGPGSLTGPAPPADIPSGSPLDPSLAPRSTAPTQSEGEAS